MWVQSTYVYVPLCCSLAAASSIATAMADENRYVRDAAAGAVTQIFDQNETLGHLGQPVGAECCFCCALWSMVPASPLPGLAREHIEQSQRADLMALQTK